MTCLCLTRNRREWLPKAIKCFQKQTYANRELLILADGDDVRDLVPDDDRIRLVHLEGHPQVGDKRNIGCELARGDIVAHWDDDDYSAPGRLADQLQRLSESGKAVTGYYSMRFTDGGRWWMYRGHQYYALGTSLLFRRDWWMKNRFPLLHIGEDNGFVNHAYSQGEFVSAEAGDLMHATIHPGNTSPRSCSGNQWREL